jgi:hypothetical protein
MALAGGWIDQPFVSAHNPEPPGSMVVVSLVPQFRFMDRSGMGTSTRKVARNLWDDVIPDRNPAELMRELYWAENRGRRDPSGSQDMAGLVYPGISRLDYDISFEGGIFPAHLENCVDEEVIDWLESIFYLLPVMPRPIGYNPLSTQNLAPDWIRKLGQSGRDSYNAILAGDMEGLGASLNLCMECWENILPGTLHHPTIQVDLPELLAYYQSRYPGAMYSGCGGGYLFVVSRQPVPGAFQVKIRH